jgi:transposase
MVQRPTRDELIALAKADPEAIADLVLMLWDRVEALEKRIAELERNSRTSSKPPSTDKGNFTNPPKPKPQSLRQKSGRKTGGQKGHPGSTLEKVANPDHFIIHDFPIHAACPDCRTRLPQESSGSDDWEVRQVFDLPPIALVVTEHRARRCNCPDCGKRITAAFPREVKAPVQYGPRVQATALYLGGYQLLPYGRLSELFGELFNAPLSEGTLANIVKRGSQKASAAMEPIREALVQSPVAHVDETGCTLHGHRHWLHVFATEDLTAYHLDAKRGVEAMARMGLIPRYRGLLIHDCLGAYFTFQNCLHGICNAHTQRELTYLHEQLEQAWAAEMIELLLEAKDLAEREMNREEGSRRVIGEGRLKKILNRYNEILSAGYTLNPEPPPKPKGQRGRVARGKALNLLDRFDKYREEIMGYFLYPGLYPYDNNQAERDVRMMKVREKISGTFRSEEHAKGFCDIRSIISSARKQSRAMLTTLSELIGQPTTLGLSLAQGS